MLGYLAVARVLGAVTGSFVLAIFLASHTLCLSLGASLWTAVAGALPCTVHSYFYGRVFQAKQEGVGKLSLFFLFECIIFGILILLGMFSKPCGGICM